MTYSEVAFFQKSSLKMDSLVESSEFVEGTAMVENEDELEDG